MPWEIQRLPGTVRELHEGAEQLAQGRARASRVVRVLEPLGPALVLGSTQTEASADLAACAAAGVEVVRRHSGGGAVLVRPGGLAWVDVFVPAGDPLWLPDVERAAWWLGEAWASALGAAGVPMASVWKGPMLRRPWSSLVCFAGLAAGEVTGPDGAKLVGLSQRRTRAGALFQSACLLRWEPELLLSLLAVTPEQRRDALQAVGEVAAGTGHSDPDDVVAPLLTALP